MASLSGHWLDEPSISGERRITIDGRSFGVPPEADVKVVQASGRQQVAHVRHGGRVAVLSRFGQLVEPDDDARARALTTAWRQVVGDTV